MNELFLKIINISISAGWLVLAVLLLLLKKNKLNLNGHGAKTRPVLQINLPNG